MPDAGPSAPKTKAGGSSKAAQVGNSDEGKKRFEVKKARPLGTPLHSTSTF